MGIIGYKIECTTPITFDCRLVDDPMREWLAANNPKPPKPIHIMAGNHYSGRVFFHGADSKIATEFLFKFHRQIMKTNLDRWVDVTGFNEPLVVWMKMGELDDEKETH